MDVSVALARINPSLMLETKSAAATVNATVTGIDLQGHEGNVAVVVNTGAITGSVTPKLQDCDTSGGTYADIPGAVGAIISTANQVRTIVQDVRSCRRFLGFVGTIVGGPVSISVTLIGFRKNEPSMPAQSTTLLPSSDISNNWAGPFTGLGGTPLGVPSNVALSSDDGATSYIAIQTAPGNGTNPQRNGLGGTVNEGRTYNVTIKVFTLSTPLSAGDFYVSLVTSVGNRYRSSVQNLAGLTSTPTQIIVPVSTISGPVGGGTANSIEFEATAADVGKYVGLSFAKVEG